jgi:hypothetical protein
MPPTSLLRWAVTISNLTILPKSSSPAAAERFYRMVVTQARQYSIELDGLFDQRIAEATVNTYRTLFDRIPAMWRQLDRLLRGP